MKDFNFSCIENTEDGGTHMKVSNEGGEPAIHILGPWEGRFRKELIVCLSDDQLEEFKRKVSEL